MLFALVVCAVAVVKGWLGGGRLGALSRVGLGAGWLLGIAVIARGALALGLAAEPALALGQVAPLGFAWVNRALPGMPLVGAGAALNALVVLANGAMPVALAAADGPRHRTLADGDALRLLADGVALPGALVSLGDLVLAAGVLALVPALMRGTARRAATRASR